MKKGLNNKNITPTQSKALLAMILANAVNPGTPWRD